jgi:hypothetical protein
MRSASPSRSSCELSREGAALRQAGPRRSGAWKLRTSTNDRYRRQNAPFMIIAVNHEVGWIPALGTRVSTVRYPIPQRTAEVEGRQHQTVLSMAATMHWVRLRAKGIAT